MRIFALQFTIFIYFLPFVGTTFIQEIVTLADDTHANYSVFLLTIVQSKFPDLLRCWSSVPHGSSTDASSQFNTKSQWGASLKWDFEQSIFIHDCKRSSITMGLNKTLRQHACYCPVDVSVYPVWSKNFYTVKPLNFHSTTPLINKTLCKSEGFIVNLLFWPKQNQVF